MKKVFWAMSLILLTLGSVFSLPVFSGAVSLSEKNTFSGLNDEQLNVSVSNDSSGNPITGDGIEKTNDLPKASVDEHRITASELDSLQNKIGDYVEGQNYNQLIDGHGTGLRPPSEQEWAEIAQQSYSIDLVSYQGSLPLSVDKSTEPWFPPIGNQGSQGSCVAWSIGYYIKTFQEAQEHSWDVSAARWFAGSPGYPTQSYQNKIISPAFIYNLQNGGEDNGLSFSKAINLICSVGVCSWEKMSYLQADYLTWPTEMAWTEAPLYRGGSGGYQWMDLSTDQGLANLKNWIASDHLVTIAIDGNKYSGLTAGDFWTLDNYVNPAVNHANTIVGYDDSIAYIENGVLQYGAFKLANSWGVGGWERVSDGFLWISYEAMKQWVGYCMFYDDLIGYEPTLTATFEISHTKRSECTIVVGMGNPNAPLATKSFSQYIDGGSFPFCQNNILLDITEFKNYVPSVYDQSYFLRVYDGGTSTTGILTSFSVEYAQASNAPRQTINREFVYLNVFLPEDDVFTLTDVTVISGGTDYTTPAVLLVGGRGTGATATAHVSCGVIYSIVITNLGSGYTSPPTVIIIDPNPRAKGATATTN